jgi:hypothetical protein
LAASDPVVVARERGVSRPVLVEQLRDAVGALAIRYERWANGDLNDASAIDLRAALGSKRASWSSGR